MTAPATGTAGMIGLGNIGQPMALTLLRSGFSVVVHDVRQEPTEPCREAGARVASWPREVAEKCDVVGVAVVDDAQLREVVLGQDGLLAASRSGLVIVVHSTVLPGTVQDLAERAAEHGCALVDAPVSGGDMGAREGTLTVMVGGNSGDIARCRPYLEAIGRRIDIMGEISAGAATKLALQLMTYCNQLAALEAVRLAAASGIDEAALMDLAGFTTADSWMVRNWGFFDRLMREHRLAGTEEMYRFFGKDLFDVVLAAREANVSVPVAAVAGQSLAGSFKERFSSI